MSHHITRYKIPSTPVALRLPGGDFLIKVPATPRLDALLERLPQREWRTYRDDGEATLLRVSGDAGLTILIRMQRWYPDMVFALRPPSPDGVS